jgi:hypothetical protein
MANSFKSYQVTGVTTEQTVFTGASGTQTTIIGMTICNTGSVSMYTSIKLNSAYLAKDIPVAVGSTFIPIGGDQKVVVETGDTVKVSCSSSTADVIMSTLEIA